MIYHVASRINSAVVISFAVLIFISSLYSFSWLGIEPKTTEAGFLIVSVIFTFVTVLVISGLHLTMREDVVGKKMHEDLLIDRTQKYFVELLLTVATFIVSQLILLSVYLMVIYQLPVTTILYAVVAFAIIAVGVYHVRSIYKHVQQEQIDKTMNALKRNAQ